MSAKREAKVELKSSAAGMDRGISDARRKLRQFDREQARRRKQAERDAKAARKQVLGAGRSVLGTVKDGIGLGLGLQAAGGITGIAADILEYEKALSRLQIAANATPSAINAFSRTIDQASLVTGISRNEILSAASAYVALTGDMATASSATAMWARIAAATGSTVSDIAQTAAALSQQMGIGPADMEATFSALAQQGKAGAIELKDLAGTMSQIAPMWAMFKGGKGLQGIRELGAALQVVKRGFGGDAGETVTGLQALLVSLQQHAKQFKDHGIRVFDTDKTGKETMRDVFSIVDAISNSKLVKHPDLLGKAFGRVEAYRAFLQLSQNREVLHKLVEEASDAGLIQRDFLKHMESPAARIEKSWNEIKLAVASAFTPERIKLFADGLTLAAGRLMEVARWIDAHSNIDENPNIVSDDADRVIAKLKAQKLPSERMREIAVQLQNINPQGGSALPPEIGGGMNTTFDGMIEAGERLGRDLSAVSAGMLVRQDERRQQAAEYLASIGARAPWLGSDPWSQGASTGGGVIDEKKLANAMAAALQRIGIGVKVGAEPLSKAVRNAPSLNTRPGGRQ